jgi:hypothetical protein
MVMTLLPLRDSIVLTFMDGLPSPEVSRSLGAPSRISNADIGRKFRRVTDLINLRKIISTLAHCKSKGRSGT